MRWLREDIVLAIHAAQLDEHGGLPGIRSADLLASALARPQTFAAYDDTADEIAIGAMYAIAIAHNHPFVDGNKRVAWVALRVFLELNGVTLRFDRSDAVAAVLGLAAGERSDAAFTTWVREHASR